MGSNLVVSCTWWTGSAVAKTHVFLYYKETGVGWMFIEQVTIILKLLPLAIRLEISDFAWQRWLALWH
jgi:hypothetical protein